jgi:hypothetical protein
MSRDESIDDVTLTAEHAGRKGSAYLMLVPAPGAIKSRAELVQPDLTHGLMIRCDWSGDSSRGTFQVKVKRDNDEWANIWPLDPGGPNVQLVSSDHQVTKVHVERGPNNPGVRFAVKLVPIRWKVTLSWDEHMLRVVLGEHYEYDGYATANDVPWVPSSPTGSQGQHVVKQELIAGQDYEIWIQLPHPTDPNAKPQEQDPVIRTGGNIPTSGGGTAGTPESGTR